MIQNLTDIDANSLPQIDWKAAAGRDRHTSGWTALLTVSIVANLACTEICLRCQGHSLVDFLSQNSMRTLSSAEMAVRNAPLNPVGFKKLEIQ